MNDALIEMVARAIYNAETANYYARSGEGPNPWDTWELEEDPGVRADYMAAAVAALKVIETEVLLTGGPRVPIRST